MGPLFITGNCQKRARLVGWSGHPTVASYRGPQTPCRTLASTFDTWQTARGLDSTGHEPACCGCSTEMVSWTHQKPRADEQWQHLSSISKLCIYVYAHTCTYLQTDALGLIRLAVIPETRCEPEGWAIHRPASQLTRQTTAHLKIVSSTA